MNLKSGVVMIKKKFVGTIQKPSANFSTHPNSELNILLFSSEQANRCIGMRGGGLRMMVVAGKPKVRAYAPTRVHGMYAEGGCCT